MHLDSLKALYIHQLKDLYSASEQCSDALPKLLEKVHSAELNELLQDFIEDEHQQMELAERLLSAVDASPHGKPCEAMNGLLREASELLKQDAEPEVRDAGIIAALQRILHYEVAGYGTTRSYAKALSQEQAQQVLDNTIRTQRYTDEQLTRLAETNINKEALDG